MEILKKEWKTILFILWLTGITIMLGLTKGQVALVHDQNAKLISTLGSVESISLGTDSATGDIAKKLDGLTSHVNFIVDKVRRH